MTNYFPQQNIPSPCNYSGVTIQITSPTVNAGQTPQYCSNVIQPQNQQMPAVNVLPNTLGYNSAGLQAVPNQYGVIQSTDNMSQTPTQNPNQAGTLQAYPQQYYLNNYNYLPPNGQQLSNSASGTIPVVINNTPQEVSADDMSSSKEIINELNTMAEEQKEAEKNGKAKQVVALTNEYIMSLENYLNNQNTEIRLMAAKEILTRLDEDHNRHDDPALNALVNKMLQDPDKMVRVAAFSALSSGLADGNDFTYELMQQVQNNPNADKADSLEAANILLKMSGTTETIYTNSSSDSNRQSTEMKVQTEESN